MSLPPTSFDGQAGDFDRRAGLPDGECRHIVAEIVSMADLFPGDLVLDVGAGTGMIGRFFPAFRMRYVGIDLSRGMLEVFRRRAAAGTGLVHTNAAREWPLPDGSVRAVFSSRAIHLLPRAHVIGEALRVAPHGVFVIGRVERPAHSVKDLMSFQMRVLLLDRGFFPRFAGSGMLLNDLKDRGARALERRQAARWLARRTPRESLEQWRAKQGLGGIALPPGVQDEVLAELEAWAKKKFGDLDAAQEAEEVYILEGVSLPGPRRG